VDVNTFGTQPEPADVTGALSALTWRWLGRQLG
jgi:hypothetical protein